MHFCLEAERFVDDRLSQLVRPPQPRPLLEQQRRRSTPPAAGTSWPRYQTLHTVLTTVAKLIAPVVPFLAEAMWRNLRTESQPGGESVHLCEYPTADQSLVR